MRLGLGVGLGLGLTVGLVTGCDDLSDPSTPCGALELGDAEPGAVVSRSHAPVLAMAGGNADPFVLYYDCGGSDPESGSEPTQGCTLRRADLEGLSGRNAVMVTSAGGYVLATDRNAQLLITYSFDGIDIAREVVALDNDGVPAELLGSLRNSNWVVGLDADRELVRYRPTAQTGTRVAPDIDGLTLATVGEQYIVGRVWHDTDDSSLYLVPVDDTLPELRYGPKLLMRGADPSRIVMTPGDEHVAVTLGSGDSAYTLVFRVPDGALVDRFEGALVSGREEMTETVGLRAVSPDGSHLAYKTHAGSIALRELGTASACLVRSAHTSGETTLAGFSAEGLLYFETESGPGRTAISAWNPSERSLSVLSKPDAGARLVAVPSRTDEDALPWAVGVRSGSYMALADSQPPESLALDSAVFIPRDDPELWVLDAESLDSGTRKLDLRRITARRNPDAALRYAELDSPAHQVDQQQRNSLDIVLSAPQTACLSTGTPGARAYACGSGGDDRFLAGATSPKGEDPIRPSTPDPEVPDLDHNPTCGFGGVPLSAAGGDCDFLVDSCCYDREFDACSANGCPDSCAQVQLPEGRSVTCVAGSGI